MSRKSLLLALAIVVVVVGSVGTTLALLVRHEPGFYRRSAVPPGPIRRLHSNAFVSELSKIVTSINDRSSKWYAIFTDAQINSYFEEQFIQSGTYKGFLPEGVSSPRIAIEADKIRLAFRYGEPPWSTIISIDLRVWLVKNEANVVALELQGLHAGSLPISAQSLLERISEACQRKKIDVKWYRLPDNGNPVALLRFQSKGHSPSVQLFKLELREGLLVIGGRSVNPSVSSPSPSNLVKNSASLAPHGN
jgi:hypothetical protein